MFRSAEISQLGAIYQYFLRGLRNLGGNRYWNCLDTVSVAMYQVSRMNFHPADGNSASEFEHVRVRMRHRYITGKHLETRLLYFCKIPDCPVGHDPDAAQCPEYICVYFSDERSQPRRLIDVFNHDYSWRWDRE